MRLGRLVWLVVVSAVLALPLATYAQDATLNGSVRDNTGGVLPGVTVTATHEAAGTTFVGVTDAAGLYRIVLRAGVYRITAELAGFATVARPGIELLVGRTATLNLEMAVSGVQETVTVTGEAPLIDTTSSNISSNIDPRQMQDLPLNGRNFIRLAQLTPGATEGPANALSSGNRPDDRRQSSAIAVNGQDTSQNNFLIDGLDNNERFIGTVIIRPQVDSIREMRVETSSFSAELGRTAGGIINVVTKSGTNVMHGSAFEFYRNETMDSKNYFAKSIPKPRYDQNQFGGSIGGPIVKDKTFFFADYAGLRLKQGETRFKTSGLVTTSSIW